MGLLDDFTSFLKTPEGIGVASGLAGYAMNARKGTPWNNIGRGGLAGLMGYAQAQESEITNGLRNMQMESYKEAIEAKKRQQAALANAPDDIRQAVAMGVPIAEIWKRQNPELKLETIYDQNTGREVKGYAMPDGSFRQVGGAKSGVTQINLGGKTVFADPALLNGQSLEHTMTPGEKASNQLGWANNRIAQQNANAPVFNADAGGWMYKPTAQNPSGGMVPVPMAAKDPTEGQAKARGFYQRMMEAEKVLSSPSAKEMPSGAEAIAESIPFVGNYAANVARDGGRQVYKQAQMDWVRAKLRKESGATIGKEEEENEYRTYFPMPGDSPEMIAQKAQARRTAMDSMTSETGKGFKGSEAPKARSKSFKLDDGKSVIATIGADGNYYVTKGGKQYRVEE